ncbi:BPL-N domain-containing protein [Anatilimnocola floriformis]|uniref:BPL-N domain-containing protein n=1 Tax=Anatilimnocola floriformis TaxID=2948575 RepID=UPI0020C2BF85|nr:BPL-N domain-containing protein [Anatilimnocola floriformis]
MLRSIWNWLVIGLVLTGSLVRAEEPKIAVAVYDDLGATSSKEKLITALGKSDRFEVTRLKAEDIRAGKLADHLVVMLPGGSSNTQGATLGEEGREEIRKFVRGGGGYIGICAGAYLATNDYDWSLHILNAKVIDRRHWARGVADLELSFDEGSKYLLGVPTDRLILHYHQGPLLAQAGKDGLPEYRELAKFETEVAKNGAPTGVMVGTTAIAAADFGMGRVLCFSPHPELTKDQEAMVHRSVEWAAKK